MEYVKGGERELEIVVNGEVITSRSVPADGKQHKLQFEIPVSQSSWVAMRQFPQLHTNPVNVLVGERPIRVSSQSVQWCIEATRLLWVNRHKYISETEKEAAREAYDQALAIYERILAETKVR